MARIWLVAGSLAAGTAVGWVRQARWYHVVLLVGGIVALTRRRSPVRLAGLAAIAFGLGMAGASARAGERAALELMAESVPHCHLSGQVQEAAGGLGTLASVDVAECEGFATAVGPGTVILDDSVGAPGVHVDARGWLVPLGDDSFDSARRRLGAHAAFDSSDVDVSAPPPGVFAVAHAVRRGLARAVGELDSTRGALLQGLTIGQTSGLDEATIEQFRVTGLTHLLAVSGSNVAIVLGSITWAARSVALRLRIALCLAGLGLFVLIAGPEPSVLRAATMGAIGLLAIAWGRRSEPLHALGLALIVVIGLRPALVFSVGLHLSAAATAGLVLWTLPVARRLEKVLPKTVAIPLAATLAAQVAVAPILIGTFGQLSVIAPATNLLAFPAVAPATILGLLAGASGSLSTDVGAVVARCAEPFAGWIISVADRWSAGPWAVLDLPRWVGAALLIPVAGAVYCTAKDV